MNSDPHDSAAWRAFGMLAADESASFDEAQRLDPALQAASGEFDRLSAAVAAISAPRVIPRPGQLERLHLRLGLPVTRRVNWPAISGWAAALALGAVLCVQRPPEREILVKRERAMPNAPAAVAEPMAEEIAISAAENSPEQPAEIAAVRPAHPVATFEEIPVESETTAIAKIETKRLIQQIEVLREQLEEFEQRDRQLLEPVEGMAWPIVMRMSPPAILVGPAAGTALLKDEPPITALLGDALLASASRTMADAALATALPEAAVEPSATPIYDAARDNGTLVVNHLPQIAEGEDYNLWVVTTDGKAPVYVGRLPGAAGEGSDSFDFSLGGAAVIPSGFLLTKDAKGKPQPPGEANTVLIGPK